MSNYGLDPQRHGLSTPEPSTLQVASVSLPISGARYHAHTTLAAATGASALIFAQIALYFAAQGSVAAQLLLNGGGLSLALTMAVAFWQNRKKVPVHQTIARQVTGAGTLLMLLVAIAFASIACGL